MPDLREIPALLARVQHAVDHRDAPVLETCFADHAELEFVDETAMITTISKRPAVVAALCNDDHSAIHFAPTIDMQFENVNISKASYVVFLAATGANPRPPVAHRYTDQLQRIDGIWRIVKRHASTQPTDAPLLLETFINA